MSKTLSKTKSLIPFSSSELKRGKFESWEKFTPKSLFKLDKESQAGVVCGKDGAPKFFIFDVFAFLDVLSKIDSALLDKLSNEEYFDKSVNPSWWLIGKIEERLPLSPEYIEELKKEVSEAKKDIASGKVYSLEEIIKELEDE